MVDKNLTAVPKHNWTFIANDSMRIYSRRGPKIQQCFYFSLYYICSILQSGSALLLTIFHITKNTNVILHFVHCSCSSSGTCIYQMRSRSSITYCSVTLSFWNFAQNTAISLPCSVQNFKRLDKEKGFIDKINFVRFEFKVRFGWISYIAQPPEPINSRKSHSERPNRSIMMFTISMSIRHTHWVLNNIVATDTIFQSAFS